jgi:N-acetylmuramic acid 6-phosphate etherase
MTQLKTEMHHPHAKGFDQRPAEEALAILAQAQIDAAKAVVPAIPAIAKAAEAAARAVFSGGKLAYAAAGSSGLMGLADGLELPGTYGLAPEQIKILLAGGTESLLRMAGGPEDDGDAARQAVHEADISEGDCLIALSASGSTPFPLAALQAAKKRGATTVGVANNSDSPILQAADIAMYLPTPPEVISGSTRMGASTAQKIALNMLSTQMAIHLGHVHDGLMVNVIADNAKLRGRAENIVMDVARVGRDRAAACLQQADGDVKLAIVLAATGVDLEDAQAKLHAADGQLRKLLPKASGISS